MQFLGCNGTDRLVPLDYYRLTFQTSHTAGALLTDGGAERALHNAYDAIDAHTDLVPTAAFSRAPGERTVVVDCKATTHANETTAQAAAAVDHADLLVDMVSLERLRGAPDPINAPSERQAIVTQNDAARPSVLSGIGAPFQGVGETLKWGLIAAGVVVAVLFVRDFEGL